MKPVQYPERRTGMKRVLLAFMMSLAAVFAIAQGTTNNRPAVNWGTISSGEQSRIEKPITRLVTNENDWKQLWSDTMGERGSLAPKGVDWMSEQLIFVASGKRNTGGYRVFVQSVEFINPREMEVRWVEETPAKGSVVTQAITSPWTAIRVKRNAGVPIFSKRTQEASCISTPRPWHPGYGYGYDDEFPRPIRWGQLDRGAYSNATDNRAYVLTTQREYERYFQLAFPKRELTSELNDVRWADEIVVAIHLGNFAQAGGQVEIESVTLDRDGRISIRYFQSVPRFADFLERTSPYLIMRLPRYNTSPIISRGLTRSR